MESKIQYFEEMKPENTGITLDLAKKKALEKGIKHVVIATTTGDTGVKAVDVFKDSGIHVVVVTHQIGPRGPELLEAHETKIKAAGATIVTCTHAFGGVSSSLRAASPRQPGQPAPPGYWPAYVPPVGDLVANLLRLFCAGMKVCLEITLMATDAGAIPLGENVVAVAGQGRGANTALVLKSANTTSLFDLDIQEIIAKPIKKRL
ncbi:MAG: hypothetical protein V1915_02020 [Candidatus Bathyarchaeota archaeon]